MFRGHSEGRILKECFDALRIQDHNFLSMVQSSGGPRISQPEGCQPKGRGGGSIQRQLITVRKRSFAKVMFLHLSVSHSVHGGGVPGQVPPGRYTPRAGTPLAGTPPQARYIPLAGTTPPGRYTLSLAGTPPGQVPPRQVTPSRYTSSLAGTPHSRYTPWVGTPPGRYPRAGTSPVTVHAGIWSKSGRYASHWNAFLLFDHSLKTKLHGNEEKKTTLA